MNEPGQRGHAAEHPSDEAKVRYFVQQQEAMLTLAGQSRMPISQLDTSAMSPVEAAEVVLRLLVDDPQPTEPPNKALQLTSGYAGRS